MFLFKWHCVNEIFLKCTVSFLLKCKNTKRCPSPGAYLKASAQVSVGPWVWIISLPFSGGSLAALEADCCADALMERSPVASPRLWILSPLSSPLLPVLPGRVILVAGSCRPGLALVAAGWGWPPWQWVTWLGCQVLRVVYFLLPFNVLERFFPVGCSVMTALSLTFVSSTVAAASPMGLWALGKVASAGEQVTCQFDGGFLVGLFTALSKYISYTIQSFHLQLSRFLVYLHRLIL